MHKNSLNKCLYPSCYAYASLIELFDCSFDMDPDAKLLVVMPGSVPLIRTGLRPKSVIMAFVVCAIDFIVKPAALQIGYCAELLLLLPP